MNELEITVRKKQVSDRYHIMSMRMPKKVLCPVIKNNCNGLGLDEMSKLFCANGATWLACSYANEFYLNDELRLRNDVKKLSWLWQPDNKYLTINNLVLVCKNWQQLDFCLQHNIEFFIEFDIMMNRGGFKNNTATLKKIYDLKDQYCINKLNIFAHCPMETDDGIDDYLRRVNNLRNSINNCGMSIGLESYENSAVYKYIDKNNRQHYDIARVGELLLLPQVDDNFHLDDNSKYDPIEWSTYISDIFEVSLGDYVGYHAVMVTHDSLVAVLPVGYYHLGNDLKKVMTTDGVIMDVLVSMHDTTIIEVPKYLKDRINNGQKIILMSRDLMLDNWSRCRQKTFRINKDMVKYNYIDN